MMQLPEQQSLRARRQQVLQLPKFGSCVISGALNECSGARSNPPSYEDLVNLFKYHQSQVT
jgi:hypothetical protein